VLKSHGKFSSIAESIVMPVLLFAILLGAGGCGGSVQNADVHSHANAASKLNLNRPVLAFYYMWYTPQTWCLCHMSDLPTISYNSSDDTTIGRQVAWAVNAALPDSLVRGGGQEVQRTRILPGYWHMRRRWNRRQVSILPRPSTLKAIRSL
jgi:hypothetical protein